jgi:hypothetical protein
VLAELVIWICDAALSKIASQADSTCGLQSVKVSKRSKHITTLYRTVGEIALIALDQIPGVDYLVLSEISCRRLAAGQGSVRVELGPDLLAPRQGREAHLGCSAVWPADGPWHRPGHEHEPNLGIDMVEDGRSSDAGDWAMFRAWIGL